MEETNTPSTETGQAGAASTQVEQASAAPSTQQGQVAATQVTESGTPAPSQPEQGEPSWMDVPANREWATRVSQENARLKRELEQRNLAQKAEPEEIPIPEEFKDAPPEQKEFLKVIGKTYLKMAEDVVNRRLEPIKQEAYQTESRMSIDRARRELSNFKEIENTPEMANAFNKLAGANMTQYEKIKYSYNQIMAERYAVEKQKEKQVLETKKQQSSQLERTGGPAPASEPAVKKYKRMSDAYRDVKAGV